MDMKYSVLMAAAVLVCACMPASCSIVTVPAETALKVTGTVAATGAKVATAPVRRAADVLAGDNEEASEN